MESGAVFVLQGIFYMIGVLTSITAAWFELRDRAQTESARGRTREWYGAKWKIIEKSGLLQLPEKAITELLAIKTAFLERLASFSGALPVWGKCLVILEILSLLIASRADYFASSFVVCGVLGLTVLLLWRLRICSTGEALGFFWAACVFWLQLMLRLSIAYSDSVMLAFQPFLVLGVGVAVTIVAIRSPPTVGRRRLAYPNLALLLVVFIASFCVTSFSLVIGHLGSPQAWIPSTPQLLFANTICDGLTLIATVGILTAAVGERRKFSIPVAVALDALVAGVLACASLWLALLGGEHALSMKQVLCVLIGRSTDGAAYELGPFFWVMHTTFLPTLFYLAVILMCWVGKLVILRAAKVLSTGALVEKPHHLTAAAFALWAVVFLGLGKVCDVVEEATHRAAPAGGGYQEPPASSEAGLQHGSQNACRDARRPKVYHNVPVSVLSSPSAALSHACADSVSCQFVRRCSASYYFTRTYQPNRRTWARADCDFV